MARALLHFIQLLSIALAYSTDCSMGTHKRIKRITDNDLNPATTNVPYLVRLDYSDEHGKHFLCSGALLQPNFVITAAHCVTGLPIQTVTVRGELSSVKAHVEPHRIVNISTPQDFGKHFKDYDIAILKVEPPFEAEKDYTQSVELCDARMESGDAIQVSGYQRHLVNATYMPWHRCKKIYKGNVDITRNMFCGTPQTYSVKCSRDAGGPVVHNGKLCGIVLWSDGWIDPKYPEVYMSTKSVRRFIEYILARK